MTTSRFRVVCPACSAPRVLLARELEQAVRCECGESFLARPSGQTGQAARPAAQPVLPASAPAPAMLEAPPLPREPAEPAVRAGANTTTAVVGEVIERRAVWGPAALLREVRLALTWWGTSPDPSALLAGVGAAIMVLPAWRDSYRPFSGTRTGELLYDRGAIPFAILLLSAWALLLLLLKLRNLLAQRSALRFELLPADLEGPIRAGALHAFRSRLTSLPFPHQRSWLFRRVGLALEHFQARGNVEEVGAFLGAQADIDATRVDSSYSLLRVLIWAIPILGFIGTVVGIGAAVEGFSGGMSGAKDVSTIQGALGKVTSGLATAFDTTLVALVASILVMFPTNALQKAEENCLSLVDEVCQERLLARLQAPAQPLERALTSLLDKLQRWESTGQAGA